MEERKKDHINLALEAQTGLGEMDNRFHYEPLLNPHPAEYDIPVDFLGKTFRAPIWVSSMTGGTKMARTINTNLARACREFGLGMGLGSCRIILDDDTYFPDFDMRETIGEEQSFFANLGIGQIEQSLQEGSIDKIHRLVDRLRADGLIIHVNPMQEWVQPEGDRFGLSPIQTISRFLEHARYPVIVKEVGQGMGPESLKQLMQLPVAAIEFGAFGGTNFSRVEMMRHVRPESREAYRPIAAIGEDAASMLVYINEIVSNAPGDKYPQLIISGGIKTYLDGYYLIQQSRLPAIYGQASAFLTVARDDYSFLKSFVESQIRGLALAKAYLRIKK